MLLGGLAIYEQKHNNNRSKEEGKIMNKKTLFSCTLWAIFALNSVAFAAEGSRSQLEEVTSDSLPIEITDVTLEGCTGTYDDRTGEYIFEQLEGIKSYSVENEYSVNVGDIDTENRHLDEMKLIESGGEETEFLDFSNKTEIMSIESSLPDLMVLKHYEAYISYLSMRWFYDENGMPRYYVDDEKREMLKIKLITKILDFKVTKAA